MSLHKFKENKQEFQKDIYVLGIRDGHNAGAALLKNGEIIAAISEERLTNIKNFSGIPSLSIIKIFDIAKITPQSISQIAIASYIYITPEPQKVEENIYYKINKSFASYLHSPFFNKMAIKILKILSPRTKVFQLLETLEINHKPVVFIEHHLAHAACAYYQKPWNEKTLIFTLDGMGDGISATVSVGEGFKIQRIAESTYYDSLSANLYQEICTYLGFTKCEHEYKIMGLAPYGNYKTTIDEFRKMIRINPKKPLEFENLSGRYISDMQPLFQKVFARKRFDDISAGVQKLFEELVLKWIKNAIKETQIYNIACAGGGFLNIKVNKLIREIPEVKNAFFYPVADDFGQPVGAALASYFEYCSQNNIETKLKPLNDLYFGEEYSEDQIKEFLKFKKVKKNSKVTPDQIAKLLTQEKIIARFSGREEWGPRALGNRSIMADPRKLEMVRKINIDIKERDFWMPFAPAMLEEEQNKYLKKPKFAPYMIEAFDTTREAKDIIAGLHQFDLTTRPQTVNDWNPGWQKIIKEFKKITGVGAILNTSFNLHGYPLVSSPQQALWTFANSQLDCLLFGNQLLYK